MEKGSLFYSEGKLERQKRTEKDKGNDVCNSEK
jgi:hypothetical protein